MMHYSVSDWLGLIGLGVIAAWGLWAYWRQPTLPITSPDDASDPVKRWLP